MNIIRTIAEMQSYSRGARAKGETVGLVPTMGYLHDGHLSLVDRAKQCADRVVVSIFVNPTQFGPNEDLESYPRDFERDCRLCEERGVDAVFAPEPEEMYFSDRSVWVVEEKLSRGLCGKSRPTHFRGVTTVVAKLFNAVLPDIAVFGQKDAQQVMVIKRMVRDLNFPVEIIVAPIVREADGLAMSSRNRYLSAGERKNALALSHSLSECKAAAEAEGGFSAAEATRVISDNIAQSGGKVDYVEVLNAENLEPAEDCTEVLIAVAAVYGRARLIDNIIFTPKNWRG